MKCLASKSECQKETFADSAFLKIFFELNDFESLNPFSPFSFNISSSTMHQLIFTGDRNGPQIQIEAPAFVLVSTNGDPVKVGDPNSWPMQSEYKRQQNCLKKKTERLQSRDALFCQVKSGLVCLVIRRTCRISSGLQCPPRIWTKRSHPSRTVLQRPDMCECRMLQTDHRRRRFKKA